MTTGYVLQFYGEHSPIETVGEMITVDALRGLLEQVLKLQSDYQTGPEWYRAYSNQLLTLLSKDAATS